MGTMVLILEEAGSMLISMLISMLRSRPWRRVWPTGTRRRMNTGWMPRKRGNWLGWISDEECAAASRGGWGVMIYVEGRRRSERKIVNRTYKG